MTPMTQAHHMELDISFKHCDPAGIVFYPRYTEMVNDVVEHWFKHGLGCDFAALHGPRGIAIPVVKLQMDFKSPGFVGETLVAELGVDRLGKSSLGLRVALRGRGSERDEALKLVADLTLVFVDMGAKRPLEIPLDLRAAAAKYRTGDFHD
jgi:4-hydroxybenzoyl-CoA thioesterase